MADDFSIIAITPEVTRVDEVEWINTLLSDKSGIVSRVHIRHPGHDLKPILESLPFEFLDKISIHDDLELLSMFPNIGFHFNRRVPYRALDGKRVLSSSCHSWDEVFEKKDLDYVTLSPIYDSVSKHGYKGNIALLRDCPHGDIKVMALGGITLDNITTLHNFDGAAMIGLLDIPLCDIPIRLEKIKEKVSQLCFSL
ncbi:MAG: thiamine phosphate synthase [Muribaculaceae bacterium]|nr:thiamine phosphate synthase [Muribaculaceae bacterium]